MPSESGTTTAAGAASPATSPTSETTSPIDSNCNGKARKSVDSSSTAMSFDPTDYVQRQRVTRAAPPKPAYNPLQFIQIKPCNLYQSAQEQLKKAEEVKKVKEVKKEDAEDWQCNLDSWKSSRRKRVEHIIERVVEVKKLEYEEHDRTRRKSKTFSEMMEERGGRRKISLPVYTEDDANDLSDLGIGTSSASGKSSLSEDFDNHSVISDNQDTEKSHSDVDNNSNHEGSTNGNGLMLHRDFVSSPGYETSSSTAPASSPDPCEYGYGDTMEEYKSRMNRVTSGKAVFSKDSTPERTVVEQMNKFVPKRPSVTKIEDRLINFELKSSQNGNDSNSENATNLNDKLKKELPKVDIGKRREMFEKEKTPDKVNRLSGDFSQTNNPVISIKDRLSNLEKHKEESNGVTNNNRLSGDITSIKERMSSFAKEAQQPKVEISKTDIPVGSLKDRLSSLHSAVNTNIPKKDYKEDEIKEIKNVQPMVVAMEKKPVEEEFVKIETVHVEMEKITVEKEQIPEEKPQTIVMENVEKTVEEFTSKAPVQKEVFREITDEDLFGDCDLISGEDIEIDNLQHDVSVLEALDIAFEAIDNGPEQNGVTADAIANNKQPLSEDDDAIERYIDDLIKQNPAGQEEIEEVFSHDLDEEEQAERDLESLHIETRVVFEQKHSLIDIVEPIYEVIDEMDVSEPESTEPIEEIKIEQLPEENKNVTPSKPAVEEEPYYQVPKSSEPYYEVPPKPTPIPLYENVDIFLASVNYTNKGELLSPIPAGVILEPPKEKPPPPPVCSDQDDSSTEIEESEVLEEDPLKRMNSTKRIKKELRNKRSSFLGLEGGKDDDDELRLSVAPPPDMSALIQEERRLEKQLFLKTGLYDCSESRDSGVSESHSRQSSEPFTNSSEDQQDFLRKKIETEIIDVLSKEEERQRHSRHLDEDSRIDNLEEQIREQEEVLRVERELLQLEQEELKRQRENLLYRENMARKELDHGAKMMLSTNRLSLQDINQNLISSNGNLTPSSSASSTTSSTYNVMNSNAPNGFYRSNKPMSIPPDYRQSMPNLQNLNLVDVNDKLMGMNRVPPTPPAKPLRQMNLMANRSPSSTDLINSEEFVQLRDHQSSQQNGHQNSQQIGNMSRHTLHALSAVPKPKLTDVWVQQHSSNRKSEPANNNSKYFPIQRKPPLTTQERMSGEPWIARKSDPKGLGYGKHWLIQEAEQRRIDQQRGVRPAPNPQNWPIKGGANLQRKSMSDLNGNNKPLPDAVIQTLTQRVQNRINGNERKRFDANPAIINSNHSLDENSSPTSPTSGQDKVLSVSGKKKCSHCDDELGRGAAMIIESLRLFYHIDCFKCCVCHLQLGDGLNGTDVRVRNQKLHCHNCFSSDDGIKFSCV